MTAKKEHAPGALGEPRQQPRADEGPNAEELSNPLVADHLGGSLPPAIVQTNEGPRAAPEQPASGPMVLTREQVVDETLAAVRVGLLSDPRRLYGALGRLNQVVVLHEELDAHAARKDLPYNNVQVRKGAFAVLDTFQRVEEGKIMNIDAPRMGRGLGMLERLRMLRGVYGPMVEIIEANDSQQVGQVSEQVEQALGRVESLVKTNGSLQRGLANALAIRGEPVAQGQQTRADNQRLVEAALSKEHAKAPAAGGTDAGKGATTVTTQVPAPVAPTPTPVPKVPTNKKGG